MEEQQHSERCRARVSRRRGARTEPGAAAGRCARSARRRERPGGRETEGDRGTRDGRPGARGRRRRCWTGPRVTCWHASAVAARGAVLRFYSNLCIQVAAARYLITYPSTSNKPARGQPLGLRRRPSTSGSSSFEHAASGKSRSSSCLGEAAISGTMSRPARSGPTQHALHKRSRLQQAQGCHAPRRMICDEHAEAAWSHADDCETSAHDLLPAAALQSRRDQLKDQTRGAPRGQDARRM